MKQPRVLIVHRSYRTKGGEDYFLDTILLPSLQKMNIETEVLVLPALSLRSIEDVFELVMMILGLEKRRPSYSDVLKKVHSFRPTHVIFNNTIPTISLKAPELARSLGAKTFLWAHNARLYCANGLTFNGRTECRYCVTRGSRWAFFQKCFPSRIQSLVYAWIYRNRRVSKIFSRSIDQYIAVSEFTARGIVGALSSAKTVTIRNPAASSVSLPKPMSKPLEDLMSRIKALPQPFFAFVGRVSEEKGADRFVELANRFPDAGFVLCGDGPLLASLKFPPNLYYAGVVGPEAKAWIYQNTAAIVICSRVPENAPLVIAESQPFATPVVFPMGGGAEESVAFFGRSGCPLDEFRAQSFERKSRPVAAHSFEHELAALLAD